jgi:tetratricopeptide (TPR) repeat protein
MPPYDLQEAIELLEKQDAAKAVALLEQMTDEMPFYAAARVVLARAYEALDQWDRALGVWKDAFQLLPNSLVIKRGLMSAVSHTLLGDVRGSAPRQKNSDVPFESEPADQGAAEAEFAEDDIGAVQHDDLDRLISELESARIVPRPDFESIPPPELEDDIEDVVSETLARIYASQGQYDEAARVYEILAGQHPRDASGYMQKALEMRSKASDG